MEEYEKTFDKIAVKLGMRKDENSVYSLGIIEIGNLPKLIDFLCSINGHFVITQSCLKRGWQLKFKENLKYFYFEKGGNPNNVTKNYFHSSHFQLIAMEAFLETFELDSKP